MEGSAGTRSVRQKAEPGTPPMHFTSSPLRAVLGDVALQAEDVQDRAAEVLQKFQDRAAEELQELLLGVR
jgi:hypothetical protein